MVDQVEVATRDLLLQKRNSTVNCAICALGRNQLHINMIILFDCSWKVWSELTRGSGVCWVRSLGNLEKLEAWCFELLYNTLGTRLQQYEQLS